MEQILDVIVRRRWTLLFAWILITAVVAAYTFTRVPQYEAHSFIMVDLNMIGSLAGDVTYSGMPGVATNGRLATELFILETSTRIEENVYARLREAEQASGLPSDPESDTPRTLQDSEVYVEPASRDVPNAIRVTAVSPRPDDAALLANLYTEEYISLAREANRSHLSARREFLEDQEDKRQTELHSAEEAVKAYMLQNGTVGLDQETQLLISKIAVLESQRDEARIQLQTQQASLEVTEDELEAINPKLAERFSSGVERQMESVQAKLAELEQQRAQILLRNPELQNSNQGELQSINRQIDALQAKAEQLAQDYVDEVMASGGVSNSESGLANIADLKKRVILERIAINGAEKRIETMNERLGEYQAELGNVPELSMDLARLERARMYAEEQYHSVVKELQQARLAEESQPGYAQVIREARVPMLPVSPNIPRNFALGLLLGLFAGLGMAFVRDKLDNRINKPDELREHGFAVVGVVPNMDPLIKKEHGGKHYTQRNGHPIATNLVSILNPMTSVSEAYRSIRTNVQFSLPDTVVRTLLVTSSGVGEGKSTTAANLAAVMAQSGRRTLLIDADMRRPRQHHFFGVPQDPGLVRVLFAKEEYPIESFRTGFENLYVLPAGGFVESQHSLRGSHDPDGTSVMNPAELIGSKRMRDLLDRWRSEFDVIIMDTPPVLAATDATLLSTQCDATLMVVRAGKTKNGELDYSMRALEDVGARVIGTVLNAFEISLAYGYTYRFGANSKYGYFSGYGYGYSAFQGSKQGKRLKGGRTQPGGLG